ncbi:MAG TPA: tRNA preQ1(34) S-adenosylmethionine ribosyltransferase-isomerase QueA [Gammaproteobacteria bacterium]|jgi:S-adenosylmethionine:tRNA ribosyltransferase-isomerase|nr:tRNA preQ1(34) S-adenosylmethionine ribosyltransferase-isomerase QueA [Gammaproteobacteria bacterium]
MKTSELNFELPESLIAQTPCDRRDMSRLLILDRAGQAIGEDVFANLPDYLRAGDCLVLNDTKVIRARIRAQKETGGRVELFLLREMGAGEWEALVRPSARMKPGASVVLNEGLRATVGEVLANGSRAVRFEEPDVLAVLERVGEIPLPPYITRESPDDRDLTRYQTVYAAAPGAVAAPTAGLHYTPEVMEALEAAGVATAKVTLHVGYGTFKPVLADDLADHRVDAEDYIVTEETAAALNAARAAGGRIVAVGTTATRVLETVYRDGVYRDGSGQTEVYIYPPRRLSAVDALQTNFHLPRSSLLALVCAFGGTEFILEAYRHAVEHEFRFYSYGDTMLIS